MREDATNVVRFGVHAVKLGSVAAAHWEASKLYVHLDGGRFLTLMGDDAKQLWAAFTSGALDLRTGELVGQ